MSDLQKQKTDLCKILGKRQEAICIIVDKHPLLLKQYIRIASKIQTGTRNPFCYRFKEARHNGNTHTLITIYFPSDDTA